MLQPIIQSMFRFLYLFIAVNLYVFASPLLAQNAVADINVYGLNPILYNGQVYNYFPGAGVKSHQYFQQEEFKSGSITIRSKKYEDVLLNYDILNQELILKYSDPQGSNRLLMVSKAWLKKFQIGAEEFALINTSDGQKIIVQTLNPGKIQLHSHWTKKLVADLSFVSKNYVFEDKRQSLYLSYNNDLQEYKSTKDILALLNPEAQEKANRYIKENKIKTRRSSTDQIIGLLNYCNQLDL